MGAVSRGRSLAASRGREEGVGENISTWIFILRVHYLIIL